MKHFTNILFILFFTAVFAQDSATLFENANTSYRNGSYKKALKTYLQIANSEVESADLCYNLGNTYYKLNQIAPSVYYYEKALLLNPNHEDAKTNLVFANRMTIDAIEEVPKSIFQRINERVIYPISYNNWAWISVVFAFLISLFILLYYFARYATRKRLYFILSFISLGLFFLFLSFTIKAKHYHKNNQPAIVYALKVSVKSEPQQNASEVFELHEGTKVQELQTIDNWSKIKLADGKIGWILSEKIKRLKK